jgi:hypothetical protein
VLPLVLYNGVRRWQAPEEVAELVVCEVAIVLRLLERRFGALDETVRQRIQAADAETLLLGESGC